MLAGLAVLAGVVADAGVDDDGVADLHMMIRRYTQIADGVDDTRGVGTEYPWRNDLAAWQSADDKQIQMIETGSPDSNAHFANARLGLRQIGAVLDLIEPAVGRDCKCSQGFIRALYSV